MSESNEALDLRIHERLDLLWIVLEARGPARLPWHRDEREFFTGAWKEHGIPTSKGRELLNDPLTIFLILQIRGMGLEAILADKDAMEALRECLLDGNRLVWKALGEYAKVWKPRTKPGPKAKGGKHKQEIAADLRAKGHSHGQISLKMFGTAAKRNQVAAMVSQWKKKLAAESRPK